MADPFTVMAATVRQSINAAQDAEYRANDFLPISSRVVETLGQAIQLLLEAEGELTLAGLIMRDWEADQRQ